MMNNNNNRYYSNQYLSFHDMDTLNSLTNTINSYINIPNLSWSSGIYNTTIDNNSSLSSDQWTYIETTPTDINFWDLVGGNEVYNKVSQLRNSLTALHRRIENIKWKADSLNEQIAACDNKITTLSYESDVFNKIILVLTESSNIARNNAKVHFEKIITEALQYVTQSTDYEFVIQEKVERSKASYEFYIKTKINGVESLQKPKDANGGGFVDIISVAAKYAYLELFNDPKISCGSVFLDEPGKMIDEQRSIKFAEYIKELGSNYDKQTIMITHNTSLKDIADQTYYVSQGNNLISKVSEVQEIPLDNIEKLVKEKLK